MPSGEDFVATDARARRKIFHGWYIVAVGFISQFAYSTSFSSTLGVFLKPMSEEFGWPRSYLSGVKSMESLFSGVAVAFLGSILDRHGARVVMVAGGVVSGVGLILLGLVGESWQFFLIRSVMIGVGILGISNIANSVAVSNWFVQRRGRVLGITNAGMGTGKVFMAPLITLIIGMSGWREGWMVLGGLVLLMVPIPAAIFIRRRPEDMGLLPDGVSQADGPAYESSSRAAIANGSIVGEAVWTRGEAARTSAFWLLVLTFGVANIGSSGLALHTIPYLTDIGFSPTLAAAALSVLSLFQVVGMLGWGFVVERFSFQHCAMVMFLSEAIGLGMMLVYGSPAVVLIGLVAYGFSLAGTAVLQDFVWASYFGRLSLGTVRSIGMPLLMLFSAAGPLYFGYLYDALGGYRMSFYGFMAALIIAAGLVLACRPPLKRATT